MTIVHAALPANWLPIPRHRADLDDWIAELEARDGADQVLRDGLARLRERVQSGPVDRSWLAVVPPAGAPRVAGLGWITVREMGADIAAMRARSGAMEVPSGFLALEQQVFDERRRGRDLIGLYRLLAVESAAYGPRLVEWFGAFAHDSRTGLTVDFEMSTTDLSLFEDLVGTSVAVLVDIDLKALAT